MRKVFLVLILVCSCAVSHAAQTILVFGDSLSAGYGLAQGQDWPTLLARRLAAEHYPYRVANASISGETSSGGAARLGAALQRFKPAILILELGANDGLRGLSLAQMRANLVLMIRQAQSNHAKVLLVGMKLPPNYGLQYTAEFSKSFADLARQYHTAYLPFLLAGFATRRDAFQADGLHPTAASEPLVLDNVWRVLEPLLRKP